MSSPLEQYRAAQARRGDGAAVRLKRREVVQTQEAIKSTPAVNTVEIEGNPIFAIMTNSELSPEDKSKEIAKFFAWVESKEERKAKIEAFEKFKEWAHAERERLALALVDLTDRDTYSILKSLYDNINKTLLDFEERVAPLLSIVQSIYTLRINGESVNAWREVTTDMRKNDEIELEKERTLEQLDELVEQISDLNSNEAGLASQKKFFGFGGLTSDAAIGIARIQEARKRTEEEIARLKGKIAEIEARPASEQDQFAKEKADLRELLNISSEEHRQRVEDLVASIKNFASTSKKEVGTVYQHLKAMSGQIEDLGENNTKLTGIFAVATKGLKNAVEENQTARKELDATIDTTDVVAAFTRDEKIQDMDYYISLLNSSSVDTLTSYSDLMSQAVRIKTMRDSNDGQVEKSRVLHTSTLAGIADRLSTVVTSISMAALGEASEVARESLSKMIQNTNEITQQEAIKVAMDIEQTNDNILKAFDQLVEFGDTVKQQMEISREGLSEMATLRANLENEVETIRKSLKESSGVSSGVVS